MYCRRIYTAKTRKHGLNFSILIKSFFNLSLCILRLILSYGKKDNCAVEPMMQDNVAEEMTVNIQISNSKEGGHTMKNMMMLFATLVFMVGAVGNTSADTTKPAFQVEPIELSINSAEFHLTQAQKLEQEVADLGAKVRELTQKVARYEKKPYLDTKGFLRDSLKRIIGTTVQKASSLREQVAWHREEASRLAAQEDVPQESAADSEDTTTMNDTSRSRSHSESPS